MRHTCYKCGLSEPQTRFWRDKSRPDGLCAACVDCLTEPNKARAKDWYKRNKDKHVKDVLNRRAEKARARKEA